MSEMVRLCVGEYKNNIKEGKKRAQGGDEIRPAQ